MDFTSVIILNDSFLSIVLKFIGKLCVILYSLHVQHGE